MKYLALPLLCLFMLVSCKDVKGPQSDALFDQVMALHDDIMPISTKLHGLQTSLKTMLATNDSIPKGVTKEDVLAVSMHTEKAYNDMMDWMRDFKVPENMNPNDKTAYLQSEKQKLEKMKEESNAAYNEAMAIVKKHK